MYKCIQRYNILQNNTLNGQSKAVPHYMQKMLKPYTKAKKSTKLTKCVFALEYRVSKESSTLSSTAHSQCELQILHLLWPTLVEQRVTWTM